MGNPCSGWMLGSICWFKTHKHSEKKKRIKQNKSGSQDNSTQVTVTTTLVVNTTCSNEKGEMWISLMIKSHHKIPEINWCRPEQCHLCSWLHAHPQTQPAIITVIRIMKYCSAPHLQVCPDHFRMATYRQQVMTTIRNTKNNIHWVNIIQLPYTDV